MDLVAENIDGIVILNVANACTNKDGNECRNCVDIGGLVHNWLHSSEVRYLIFDFQDEKDLCKTFLVELMQLRKRLKHPFLFSGVMDRPKGILKSYDLQGEGADIFVTPEEAVAELKKSYASLASASLSGINFGEPIVSLKARQAQIGAEEADVDGGGGEDDVE